MSKSRQPTSQITSQISPTLTVFLAGSLKELSKERNAVSRFIKRKNKELAKINQNINLFICEESSLQAQKDFNKKIRSCDIFIVLYQNKVGKNTNEEYEIAWKLSKIIPDKPIIRMFAKPQSIRNTKNNFLLYLNSRWQFEIKCSKRKHYAKPFTNNRNLILQIKQLLDDYLKDISD